MGLGSILRGAAKGISSVLKGGGRVVGGALGGPVGAAVGTVAGVLLGEAVEKAAGQEPKNTGIYPPDLPKLPQLPPSPPPRPTAVNVPGPLGIPTPIITYPSGEVKMGVPGTGPGGIVPGLPDPGDILRLVQGGLSGLGLPVSPPAAAPSTTTPQAAGADVQQWQQALMMQALSKTSKDGRAILKAMVSGALQKGLFQTPVSISTPLGTRYYSPPGFRTVWVMGKPISVFKPIARALRLLKEARGCYISYSDVKKARAAKSLQGKIRRLSSAVGLRLSKRTTTAKRRKR